MAKSRRIYTWNVVWFLFTLLIGTDSLTTITRVYEGMPTTLSCITNNVSIVSFIWTWRNASSPFNQTFSVCERDMNNTTLCSSYSNLTLFNVQQQQHGGLYQCSGRLEDNTSILITMFKVEIIQINAPSILYRSSIRNIVVQPGRNVTIHVSVSDVSENQIQWLFNDTDLTSSNDVIFSLTYHTQHLPLITNSTLQLQSLLYKSSGIYTINASNSIGYTSTDFVVNVRAAAEITYPNHTSFISLNIGETAFLNCIAKGIPRPSITWIPAFKEASSPVSNYSDVDGYYYTYSFQELITGTEQTHSVNYTCSASNGVCTTMKSNLCSYNLTYVITISREPTITSRSDNLTIYSHQNVNFTCTAEGYPIPYIIWSSTDWEIEENDSFEIRNGNRNHSTLLVDATSLNDSVYIYTCLACNRVKCTTANISLTVQTMFHIICSPNNTEVTSSKSASFLCVASYSPFLRITWTFINDTQITANNMYNITTTRLINKGEIRSTLIILNTSLSVNGTVYQCNVTRSLSNQSNSIIADALLQVNVIPDITSYLPVQSSRYEVNVTDDITFQCTATGVPPPDIQWYKGEIMLNFSRDSRVTIDVINVNNSTGALATVTKSLTLTQTVANDAGSYSCNATNAALGGQDSALFELFVRVPASIAEEPVSQSITLPSLAEFNCSAFGVPLPNISWIGPNNEILLPDKSGVNITTHHISPNTTRSVLLLSEIYLSSNGTYICSAGNSITGSNVTVNTSAVLYVQIVPNITSYLPKGSSLYVVNVDNNITFQCTATGVPSPDIQWYRGGVLLNSRIDNRVIINTLFDNESNESLANVTRTLTLMQANTSDAGSYSCNATNAAIKGQDSELFELFVRVPASITEEPVSQSVTLQSVAVFNCSAFGVPLPNITWTGPNNEILVSEKSEVNITNQFIPPYTTRSVLLLSNVNLSSSGTYICSAGNSITGSNVTISTSADLMVHNFYFITTLQATSTKKTNMSIVHTTSISATFSTLLVIVPSVTGIVCVFACIFLTLISGIYLITRNNKNKESVNGVDGIEVELIRKDSEVPLCYFPPEQGSEYREPIPLELLSTHLDTMHWNENCGFVEEYKIIQEKSPNKQATVCLLPENSSRNRYKNIKCFDETRVKLTPDESSSNDYINANFIKGYNRPKEYIACQGPLDDTIVDFWKMVYDYDAPTIVMLTNLVEKMKMKCSQYWPQSDSETYSKYEVTVVNTTTLADFVIRNIKITNKEDGKMKEVKQLHFISWPDFGVPRNPTPLLHFLQRVRTFHPYSDIRPMVFHCSAGVGRTGTLITIDVELQRADKENKIDPFNFVRELREQRNFMVQAEAQYIFLHDAILEGSVSGNTEVPVEELSKKMEYLKEGNEEMDNGYKKEFELLKQFKIDVRELSVANEDKNAFKNRVTNALPYNHNRVILQMKPGCSGSDYINASFVDGYSKKAAYIATQGPLPNTVEDFWRMVWEKSVNVIVMLTQLVEKDKEMCCCYWPEKIGSTKTIGDFIVELLSEDQYDDYCTREMKILEQESGKSCMLRQFHFTSWPEHGAPESGAGMVDLIDQVTRRQRQTGDNHIVVHCSAGVGRTGAFICLSIAIERVQSEGTVDIFHTIKHLRTQRPHLIQNVDQYIFCYNAIRDYVESLDNYSNLK